MYLWISTTLQIATILKGPTHLMFVSLEKFSRLFPFRLRSTFLYHQNIFIGNVCSFKTVWLKMDFYQLKYWLSWTELILLIPPYLALDYNCHSFFLCLISFGKEEMSHVWALFVRLGFCQDRNRASRFRRATQIWLLNSNLMLFFDWLRSWKKSAFTLYYENSCSIIALEGAPIKYTKLFQKQREL